MFLMLLVCACLFCAAWTIYRVTGQSERSRFQRFLISLVFLGVFLVPIWIKDRADYSNIFLVFLYHLAYFSFIVAVLFFCLIAVRDGIWIVGSLFEKIRRVQNRRFHWWRPVILSKTNKILFVLAMLFAVLGLFCGLKTPSLKEIEIETARLEKPLTIVVLSDLHLHQTMIPGRIEQIVRRVNNVKPDLIVLPGDTIDDEPHRIQHLLASLKKLKAPLGVYATAGNHEFYVGHEKSKEALEGAGINYLFNQSVALRKDLYLAGVPDANAVRRISSSVDIQRALRYASDREYKILLSHVPSLFDRLYDQKIDLQISGHTHGGQIFPFHFVSWFLNKYLSGLYSESNRFLYVSRGSGQWGPQIRIFAPSEISVIRLIPQKPVTVAGVLPAPTSEPVIIQKTNPPVLKKSVPSSTSVGVNENQAKEVDKKLVAPAVVIPTKNDVVQAKSTEVLASSQPIQSENSVEQRLLLAQQAADKEASLQKEEQILSEKKSFDEAKAQTDDEFEQALRQQQVFARQKAAVEKQAAVREKALIEKAKQRETALNKRIEACSLSNAACENKALQREKKLLKRAEAKERALQKKLTAALKKENRLSLRLKKMVASNKEMYQALKRERQFIQLAIKEQKKMLAEIKTLKSSLAQRQAENVTQQKLLNEAQQALLNTDAKVVSADKNIRVVHNAQQMPTMKETTIEHVSQRQLDPAAVMTVTRYADGRVLRTVTRTRIQETPTQVKTIKTVTSYVERPVPVLQQPPVYVVQPMPVHR